MNDQATSTSTTVTRRESGTFVLRLGSLSFLGYLAFHIDILAIGTSLLLGSFFASTILSRLSLKGIRINISTKQIRSRVNEPLPATLELVNRNRILPVFYPVISVREKDSLKIQSFQHQGVLLPKKRIALAIDPSFTNRGLRQLEAFAPRSQFPFALHEATSSAKSFSTEVIVWPKSARLDVASLFIEPPAFAYQTTGEKSRHSQDVEASRIRDYQAGDAKTRINWKLSAKQDKLTVIDPNEEREDRYYLHLDTSNKLWESEFVFDIMLQRVSFLVNTLTKQKLLRGITVDNHLYPLEKKHQAIRFYDNLATLHATKKEPEGPKQVRRKSLWILPAPHSQIRLASHEDLVTEPQIAK